MKLSSNGHAFSGLFVLANEVEIDYALPEILCALRNLCLNRKDQFQSFLYNDMNSPSKYRGFAINVETKERSFWAPPLISSPI